VRSGEEENEGKGGRGEKKMLGERRCIGCTFQIPSAVLISLVKANDPVSSIFLRISTALINSLRVESASFSAVTKNNNIRVRVK
jgi:hypothetical protein